MKKPGFWQKPGFFMSRSAIIITIPTLASLVLTLLLGWLAGGLVNWAADVLPGRGRDQDPAPVQGLKTPA